jgi:hypothetical protein
MKKEDTLMKMRCTAMGKEEKIHKGHNTKT